MILVVVVIVLLLFLYLWQCYELDTRIVLGMRITLSFLYVLLGLVAFFSAKEGYEAFRVMILVGLFMRFASDIILELRSLNRRQRKYYLFMSMIVATMSNFIYLLAFYTLTTLPFILYLIIATLSSAIMLFIGNKTGVKYKEFRPIAYIFTFFSMSVFVVAVSATFGQSNVALGIMTAAIMLYMASDYFLSYVYFKQVKSDTKRILKRANIGIFYVAQTLLALMIYFISI